MQFIQEHVQGSSEDALAQRLTSFFEQKADLNYSRKELLQMDGQELIFQLVDLGYADEATTKCQPRRLSPTTLELGSPSSSCGLDWVYFGSCL